MNLGFIGQWLSGHQQHMAKVKHMANAKALMDQHEKLARWAEREKILREQYKRADEIMRAHERRLERARGEARVALHAWHAHKESKP